MSLWEFYCVQEGFRAFCPPSTEDKGKPPTTDEFEEAVARYADI